MPACSRNGAMKMKRTARVWIAIAGTGFICVAVHANQKKAAELSPLDKYAVEVAKQVEGARQRIAVNSECAIRRLGTRSESQPGEPSGRASTAVLQSLRAAGALECEAGVI